MIEPQQHKPTSNEQGGGERSKINVAHSQQKGQKAILIASIKLSKKGSSL